MRYPILIFLFLSIQMSAQEEMTLLGRWVDTNLVASRAHDNVYNEIWGLAINDREFAVIGTTYGTHFIDVTDPLSPKEAVRVPGKAQGTSVVHRDYHNIGRYLYAVCDEGPSTLQIMDIGGLPDTVRLLYDSDELIQRSHNIFIDTSSSLLFSCATNGTQIGSAALSVFDIKDPVDPKHIENFRDFGDIRAGHVHDIYVRSDTGYLNCGYDGFAIADFSNPDTPVTITTLKPNEYPESGYNHSGWLSDDGTHYYMADENHGHALKALSTANYNDVFTETTFDANSPDSNSIAHNPLVACDYLFVAYYYDGLQVFDISDPSSPKRAFFYPTSQISNDRRYKGAWGVYPFLPSGNILVSDMQQGLYVLEAIDECDLPGDGKIVTNSILENKQHLKAFPNPADQMLIVKGIKKGSLLEIFNMEGILVEQLKYSGDPIQVTSYPTGSYIIRTAGTSLRFIKN